MSEVLGEPQPLRCVEPPLHSGSRPLTEANRTGWQCPCCKRSYEAHEIMAGTPGVHIWECVCGFIFSEARSQNSGGPQTPSSRATRPADLRETLSEHIGKQISRRIAELASRLGKQNGSPEAVTEFLAYVKVATREFGLTDPKISALRDAYTSLLDANEATQPQHPISRMRDNRTTSHPKLLEEVLSSLNGKTPGTTVELYAALEGNPALSVRASKFGMRKLLCKLSGAALPLSIRGKRVLRTDLTNPIYEGVVEHIRSNAPYPEALDRSELSRLIREAHNGKINETTARQYATCYARYFRELTPKHLYPKDVT